MGNLVFRAVSNPPPPTADCPDPSNVHFYCSSGGNAGLACATAAAAVGRKATIVVPDSTSPYMVAKLRALDAEVVQTGANWAAADAHLRSNLLASHGHDPASRGVYVPPFDHPDIWHGVSYLVDELAEQLPRATAGRHHQRGSDDDDLPSVDPAPLPPLDGVVCNVGGGGLLCGLMEGLHRNHGRKGKGTGKGGGLAAADGSVPRVLAVETVGAHSLKASAEAGELVSLPGITSIATSLGATRVAEKAFEWTQRCGTGPGGDGSLVCATVTDAEAVMGSVNFLEDARILVEVACGATIATAYNGALREYFGKGLTDAEWAEKNVVLVVCGGSSINIHLLQKYRDQYGV